jgi:pyrroline-5-carboxylate reductase
VTHDLAFIGAGNMAEAIARSVITRNLVSPSKLVAFDPAESRRRVFESIGVRFATSNAEAAPAARVVLLCVKPQMVPPALAEIAPALTDAHLIISIVAGISTGFIESHLGGGGNSRRVIRAMPNTPMLVGLGATALCRGRHAMADDLALARRLFESAGVVIEVDEPLMDAVTAISGSGPAYFFYLVEHMIAAATSLGLSADDATKLVYQTAAGAARMLQTSSESPAELRRRVTSPGGTTQAAIEHFEQHQVGKAIEQAIAAAQKRGRELGR